MPKFKVFHVEEQGVDLIIVPLESSFGHQTTEQQNAPVDELQMRSSAAGLAGGVVLVWDSGSGSMAFLTPQQWHPFFRSINLGWVWANVNREIYW
jgi:hypothetical protein